MLLETYLAEWLSVSWEQYPQRIFNQKTKRFQLASTREEENKILNIGISLTYFNSHNFTGKNLK